MPRKLASVLACLALAALSLVVVAPAHAVDVVVPSAAETKPVPSSTDAADDTATWIHPTDPSKSVVIGTDKLTTGGIGVYDLAGNELHFYLHGSMNNVDLRYNFPLGSEKVAIVGVTDRNETSTGVQFYKVNVADRSLTKIGHVTTSGRPRGFSMYHSPVSGKYYAFVHDFHTNVIYQYELNGSTGSVTGTMVRSFDNGNSSEGIVADDELQHVYVAEEETALWKYGAEPNAGSARTAVDYATIAGGRIIDNIKNPTIYYGRNGTGYLIVSSQGGSNFVVYERGGNNAYVGSFKIGAGPSGSDGVNGQDGIDVTNFGLGSAFPGGLFSSQDHNNTDAGNGNSGNQNFKYVSWQAIADSFTPKLLVDPLFDPRQIGADGGGTPPPPDTTAPETTIDSGPSGTTGATTAAFTFSANEAATFECRLDAAAFAACTSPKQYSDLAAGAHTFEVRAKDAAGNVDASPATRTWTVDPAASATLTFVPDADAAVEAATPSTNFGAAPTLKADSSPQEESYVRFDVSGLTGSVDRATLRLYLTNGSTNGPAVYGTASSWQENAITWGSGRPARVTGVLDDKGALTSGTWAEYDVTSFVTGDGPTSFNVAPTSSDGADMSSREAASNRPQLVVTTSGSTPPPSDTTAPTVTSVSPVDGATGVATGTTVKATFSESVQAGTVSTSTLQLTKDGTTQPLSATVTYDDATKTATLTPTNPLEAGATYGATVTTGVKDLAGNALAAPKQWSFTTASVTPPADTTPPTVTAVSPTDGATGVATATTVTATFSEAVQADTVSASSFQLTAAGSSQPVSAAVAYDAATRTATLTPLSALQAGTSYDAVVTEGVKDLAGNAMAAPHQWSFSTAADTPPPSGEVKRESTATVENSTATSTVAVPRPTGTTAGDVLVSCLATNGANVAADGVPAGWTAIASVTAASNPRVFGYYRVAGASEPSTYAWTLRSSVANSAGIARYSGVDTTTPLDAAPSSASGAAATTATVPGVTTATAGAMLVSCMGVNSSVSSVGITAPTGMAGFWDLVGKRQRAAETVQAAAGPSGGKTWTFSSSRAWAGWMVALRPQG